MAAAIKTQAAQLAEAKATIKTQAEALDQAKAGAGAVKAYADMVARVKDVVSRYNKLKQSTNTLQAAHDNLVAEKALLENQSDEALAKFNSVKADAQQAKEEATDALVLAKMDTVTAATYGTMVAQVKDVVARYNKLKLNFNEVKVKVTALQELHNKLTQEKQELEQGAEHAQVALSEMATTIRVQADALADAARMLYKRGTLVGRP